MWFSIDYKRIVIQFLPIELRRSSIVALGYVLLAGTVSLYDQWRPYRESNLYKLGHNGQVCRLRKVLNDYFDVSERRIRIVDGAQYNRSYIYTNAEAQPRYLGRMYLRPSTDFADSGVDFIVLVPVGLDFNMDDMKAMIDYYRLASKRYDIRYE